MEWPRFSFHIHSGLEQNRIEIRRRRREGGGRREARKGCEDSVRFQGSFWSDCEVRAVPEQFQGSSGAVPEQFQFPSWNIFWSDCEVRAVSEQFPSSFRAVSEQFRSSSSFHLGTFSGLIAKLG